MYAAESSFKCTVLISMKLRPYMDAAEGIRDFFKTDQTSKIEFYFLEDVEKRWKKDTSQWLSNNLQKQAVIAIGPESVFFLKEYPPKSAVIRVFTMIANSGFFNSEGTQFCGNYLSTHAEDHVSWIASLFPDMKNIGVLYDEKFNKDYITKAQLIAKDNGVTIHPLAVASKGEVPEMLRQNWDGLNGLVLIPDATVISESLVKYIIKDGLSNNVPVIGYNRFFIRNGAMMAFIHDYQSVGYKTAEYLYALLENRTDCRVEPAEFKIVLNNKIAEHVGVELTHALQHSIVETNE